MDTDTEREGERENKEKELKEKELQENGKIVAQRIPKSRESRWMVLLFSMVVIVISALLFQRMGTFTLPFLVLVILFYIISAPQTRLGYYLVDNNLVLGNLLGRKVVGLKDVEDLQIIDIPLTSFPFLTNGVGYHVGKPRIKNLGKVQVNASVLPAKGLLLVTRDEKIAITPHDPESTKNHLEKAIQGLISQDQENTEPEDQNTFPQ